MNDENLQDYAALAIVEPYVYEELDTGKPHCGSYRQWNQILPTVFKEDGPIKYKFRAMIWVNNNIQTEHIPIDSSDMVAVILHFSHRDVLLIAAYDPRDTSRSKDEMEEALQLKLDKIRELVQQMKRSKGERLDILICSDFNRHDPLWGGEHALSDDTRRGEGDSIIDLASELDLQSMLASGTITWEDYGGRSKSTIDIVLASTRLAEAMSRCQILETDHGSDHKAIHIATRLGQQESQPRLPPLLFEKADWNRINKDLIAKLPHQSFPTPDTVLPTQEQLDEAAELFHRIVYSTVIAAVPRAKPSPYCKRWWTTALTSLRQSFTSLRNRLTTIQRRGGDCTILQHQVQQSRKAYINEIAKQKKKHWEDFLSDPNNVWKANQYTKLGNSSSEIPTLVKGQVKADTDEDKSKMLIDTFFPTPPTPTNPARAKRTNRSGSKGIGHPVTIYEIRTAILLSNPKKAAGIDELKFEVWKNILPSTINWIAWLYHCSLRTGYVPKSWKIAKIIPLRKPGKPDYTVPKAYRPISLLLTLSKGLEKLVANRLSFWAESGNLLPTNHFGARKGRSAEQAVNLILEYISNAWRVGKTVSLITFDVQGAFNGVFPTILGNRLHQRGIPHGIVQWIVNFCQDRTAIVVVGRYQSDLLKILHAGIPQGSPLSPILYDFYNANLVECIFNNSQGSTGFIDDFTAWMVAKSITESTRLLQEQVIPKVERWAAESGATFEAEKTGLIHFHGNKMKGLTYGEKDISIHFMGKTIKPQKSIRLLGVVLDEQLKMKEHVLQATVRATKKCMALARLRGIRPKQMRQLYKSVVIPTMDYGAAAWYATDRHGYYYLNKHLERVQRLGAKAITGAFRTVSLEVLQDEAILEPTTVRLAKKVVKQVINTATRDSENPLSKCMSKWSKKKRKYSTALQATWAEYYNRLRFLIHPRQSAKHSAKLYYTAPWSNTSSSRTTLILYNREEAIKKCKDIATTKDRSKVFYTDGSKANNRCGSAVVQLDRSSQVVVIKAETIGTEKTCSVLSAEMTAIRFAVEHIQDTGKKWTPYWIMSDSQDAIQSIDKGQGTSISSTAATRMLTALNRAQGLGFEIHMIWCPSHSQIQGNQAADLAAKAMTAVRSTVTKNKEMRVVEPKMLYRQIQQDLEGKGTTKPRMQGKYTYDMDKALPGKHTMRMYGMLTHEEAGILMQARTGHTHLNVYLKRIGKKESASCSCGAEKETVKHVILTCPTWQTQRQKLRETAKERWNDISFLLGGWSGRLNRKGDEIDGPKEQWKPKIAAVKATINFLKETNRMVSIPRPVNSSQDTEPVSSQTRITSYFTLI